MLLPQQGDGEIQFGFVEARFLFKRFAIFNDGLGVLIQQAIGERQIEMRSIVFGVGGNGIGKVFDRCLVTLLL